MFNVLTNSEINVIQSKMKKCSVKKGRKEGRKEENKERGKEEIRT